MSFGKIGRFRVVDTLGTGAHSTVLRVVREADRTEYALKVVVVDADDDRRHLDQVRHEWRVGQMLGHECLVKVFAFEVESDWRFRPRKAKLLTEYVPGPAVDKARLLNPAKLLRVLERAAAGLVHMHKKGVCHADLKPGNILVGPRLAAKVIDYGLARVRDDPPVDRVRGTPEYMAPETVTHKMISERTDIFNFGATMYRLATLRLPPRIAPADGGKPLDKKTYKSLLVPVWDLNPSAPRGFGDLVHRCLSYNALKRPERMSEVQGALDKLADEAAAAFGDPFDGEE